MAKPFDATMNALINLRPDDWANYFGRLVGILPGPSEMVDTDLATTVQADKVFRFQGDAPSLLHLELEANHRLGIPRDLWRYNTLVDHEHSLPAETVLVLLRPKALASDQTGVYQRFGATGRLITEFHYHVERVWERPVEYWLSGGIGLAPLALLTDESSRDLESALGRMREYLDQSEIGESAKKTLIGSSYVLCGLRYQPDRIADMFRRLSMLMEDSGTYQEILAKGVSRGISQGERAALLHLGKNKYGKPTGQQLAKIEAITSIEVIETLLVRVQDTAEWDELLAGL